MNTIKKLTTLCLMAGILLVGCKSMNRTQKGAVIGTAGGGAVGAVIGKASGNTALGAIIGAAVGGAAGAVIGNKMDKQARRIEEKVPNATVERVGEGIVVEFQDKVLFGFDQSTLNATAKKSLDQLVIVLNEYPETNIEIQGHTDSKGTESYNEKLSKRRANAVSAYLSNKGVRSSRLSERGFGESAPKASNDTADGQAENRRVDFLITANEKMKAEAKAEGGK